MDGLTYPKIERLEMRGWMAQGVDGWIVREDLAHPLVAGPKYYRLKAWVQQVQADGAQAIVSAGGMHSNHLHGLACVAQQVGVPVRAYVRGLEVRRRNDMLIDCQARGMKLVGLTRAEFDARGLGEERPTLTLFERECFIPMGAGGIPGAQAMARMAASWLRVGERPDWIALTAGTGTTLRGIAAVLPESVRFFVAAPFKEPGFLLEGLDAGLRDRITLTGSVGGTRFGKLAPEAHELASHFSKQTGLACDNLYFPTLLWQLEAHKALFKPGERIWVLHCGGSPFNRLGG